MTTSRTLVLATAALLLVVTGCAHRDSPSAGQITQPQSKNTRNVLTAQEAQNWNNTVNTQVQAAQSSLPHGTRVYVLHTIHVHDPIMHKDEDFAADSLITRTANDTVVTPPDQTAQTFSSQAQVTRNPQDVQYFYVRPGENPSAFVREHATLDHVIK